MSLKYTNTIHYIKVIVMKLYNICIHIIVKYCFKYVIAECLDACYYIKIYLCEHVRVNHNTRIILLYPFCHFEPKITISVNSDFYQWCSTRIWIKREYSRPTAYKHTLLIIVSSTCTYLHAIISKQTFNILAKIFP